MKPARVTPTRDSIPADSTPELPRGCTALKVRQLSRRVSQHFDRIVAVAGLKTTQFSLLSVLASQGTMRPGDLAAAMQMDASTLTRNLQPLAAQGWVLSGPGLDARSRSVTITESGRAKRAEAEQAWRQAQTALNSALGADKVVALHALLDDCIARLA